MDEYFYLLGRHTEEPARLNDLETLVHQRRRIDGDLRPMSQVGWRSASAAVTWRSCSWVNLRKGPPEQVSSSLLISLSPSPTKLGRWQNVRNRRAGWAHDTPRQAGRSTRPPRPRSPLLARQIVFRARMARIVGVRPLNSTIAVSTIVIGPASTIGTRRRGRHRPWYQVRRARLPSKPRSGPRWL